MLGSLGMVIMGEAWSTGIWQGWRELWLICLRYRANFELLRVGLALDRIDWG